MIRDYRFGWHETRATFGNANAGERLADTLRHLTDLSGKLSLCNIEALPYARYSWLAIAQRLDKAPICQTCETLGKQEEATLT